MRWGRRRVKGAVELRELFQYGRKASANRVDSTVIALVPRRRLRFAWVATILS
jgi:hypothetical protein